MSESNAVVAEDNPLVKRVGTVLEGYITDEEMARQRGVSRQHQRRERALGCGPPFTKDGRRVIYHVESFRRWLAQLQKEPRKRRR